MRCPICDSDQVRGFKVHRDEAWWSQCISDENHGTFTAVYEDGTEKEIAFPKRPWFVWRNDGSFLVEVNGRDFPFN